VLVYELYLFNWRPRVFLYAFFLHFLSRLALIPALLGLHRRTRSGFLRGLIPLMVRPAAPIEKKEIFMSNGKPMGPLGYLGCGSLTIVVTIVVMTLTEISEGMDASVFVYEIKGGLWLWLVYLARDIGGRGLELNFESSTAANLSRNEGGRVFTLLTVAVATVAVGWLCGFFGALFEFSLPGAWIATLVLFSALFLDDVIQDVVQIVKPREFIPRGVGALLILVVLLLPFAQSKKSKSKAGTDS